MRTFDLTPPSAEERRHLEAGLSPEERHVLLQHAPSVRSAARSWTRSAPATYCCRLCGLPLFRAGREVRQRHGLAELRRAYDAAHLDYVRDASYGMVRTEIRCARCGSHQGHVFPTARRRPGNATASIRFRSPSRRTARRSRTRSGRNG